MAFPAKDYERLKSLEIKWGMSREDMLYAIENGLLRACIWLPLRYVERIAMKDLTFVFEKHEHQSGFVGVRPEDCRRICSTGCANLRIFNSVCKADNIIRLAYEPPQPDISVRISDLIILKEDQQSFEQNYDIPETNVVDLHPERPPDGFIAAEDYRYVKLGEQEFHLGDIQARIVQMLHDASQSHKPWVHGKTLLHESASNAVRIRDLFKSKKNWRDLIVSDDRGYYRLNIPMEKLEKSAFHKSMENTSAASA